jgi:hypothetical protein
MCLLIIIFCFCILRNKKLFSAVNLKLLIFLYIIFIHLYILYIILYLAVIGKNNNIYVCGFRFSANTDEKKTFKIFEFFVRKKLFILSKFNVFLFSKATFLRFNIQTKFLRWNLWRQNGKQFAETRCHTDDFMKAVCGVLPISMI